MGAIWDSRTCCHCHVDRRRTSQKINSQRHDHRDRHSKAHLQLKWTLPCRICRTSYKASVFNRVLCDISVLLMPTTLTSTVLQHPLPSPSRNPSDTTHECHQAKHHDINNLQLPMSELMSRKSRSPHYLKFMK